MLREVTPVADRIASCVRSTSRRTSSSSSRFVRFGWPQVWFAISCPLSTILSAVAGFRCTDEPWT